MNIEQIEKIEKLQDRLIKRSCTEYNTASSMYLAEAAKAIGTFLEGYRKQKWISVEERLPERNGRYLTHCDVEGQTLVCILYCCKVGGFNEGTVTHWMPLPEPPKMKGGAE